MGLTGSIRRSHLTRRAVKENLRSEIGCFGLIVRGWWWGLLGPFGVADAGCLNSRPESNKEGWWWDAPGPFGVADAGSALPVFANLERAGCWVSGLGSRV